MAMCFAVLNAALAQEEEVAAMQQQQQPTATGMPTGSGSVPARTARVPARGPLLDEPRAMRLQCRNALIAINDALAQLPPVERCMVETTGPHLRLLEGTSRLLLLSARAIPGPPKREVVHNFTMALSECTSNSKQVAEQLAGMAGSLEEALLLLLEDCAPQLPPCFGQAGEPASSADLGGTNTFLDSTYTSPVVRSMQVQSSAAMRATSAAMTHLVTILSPDHGFRLELRSLRRMRHLLGPACLPSAQLLLAVRGAAARSDIEGKKLFQALQDLRAHLQHARRRLVACSSMAL